tara:strand:- start:70955 stop:71299 length:345 start_codon:yes stop_codon:yes gene_type:complete
LNKEIIYKIKESCYRYLSKNKSSLYIYSFKITNEKIRSVTFIEIRIVCRIDATITKIPLIIGDDFYDISGINNNEYFLSNNWSKEELHGNLHEELTLILTPILREGYINKIINN